MRNQSASTLEAPQRRLHYLALERLRPASAADTHVRGMINGLQRLGWKTSLFAEVDVDQSRPGFASQLLRYLRLQIGLALRLGSADVIYVRQHFASWPIVAWARLLRKPLVVELNGQPADALTTYPFLRRIGRLIAWSYRSQFSLASHVVTVTEGLAQFIRGQSPTTSVSVIPNGADSCVFQSRGQPLPKDAPTDAYVMTFGDFAKWHNLNLLVAAVKDSQWPVDVRLLLIGQSLSASPKIFEGAEDRIIWLERRTQVELASYIVHSVAGIVPISDHGGRGQSGVMPLKLIEILSCGRPAIVTDIPGQAELVRNNQCGLVVPPDDPRAMAEAVRQLAGHSETLNEMGRAGRVLVETTFNWNAIAKQADLLLRQLIERPRSGA